MIIQLLVCVLIFFMLFLFWHRKALVFRLGGGKEAGMDQRSG